MYRRSFNRALSTVAARKGRNGRQSYSTEAKGSKSKGFYAALAFASAAVLAATQFDWDIKTAYAASGDDENKRDLDRKKKRIVILGSGWGAVSLLKEIGDEYEVIVVSPRNYFLFTPLLTGVTVGTNDERSVIEPIRTFCKRSGKNDIIFYEAKCTSIDPESNKIICEDISPLKGAVDRFELTYDYLVVAVGAINNTFGTPGVEKYAHFLKSIEDAVSIRSRLMDAFESANYPGLADEEKRRLLRFVVVGGGPTGVEYAAELHDFLTEDVQRFFPHLMPYTSIVLIQSGDHILNTFDEKISEFTEKKFKRDNITVLTNMRVREVKEKEVVILDAKTKQMSALPYAVCVWNTGITQTPLVQSLTQKIPVQNHQRALLTDSKLLVKGTRNIFALGDCSSIELPMLRNRLVELFWKYDTNDDGVISKTEFQSMFEDLSGQYPQLQVYQRKAEHLFGDFDTDGDGVLTLGEFEALLAKADSTLTTLPATAQVASQQGKYMAHVFNDRAKNPNIAAEEFHYRHFGTLAKIGGTDAVAEIGNIKSGGFWTWWMYGAVYLSKQFSLRNRWLVANDWVKRFLFGRDISRF